MPGRVLGWLDKAARPFNTVRVIVLEGKLNEAQNGDDLIKFEWSKAIETGRLDIDQEHRKIIDYLNDLREAVSNRDKDNIVSGVLLGLKDYVDIHFSHEEEIMNSFDYDERTMHLAAHAGFAKRINAINDEHLESAETAQALMLFAYDWLIKHITGVDRIMVRKFNGDNLISWKGDEEQEQTSVVIDGAYATVAEIEALTSQLAGVSKPAEKRHLKNRLAEASSRLINLVTLASHHVSQERNPGDNRERLNGLMSGLVSSSKILLENKALKLIDYGTRIMGQTKGTPFGCGSVVTMHMNGVLELIDVMGGMKFLAPDQQETVTKAAIFADAVRDMEAQSYRLPSFGTGEIASHLFKEAIAKRAASQADILSMLQKAKK
ncbi:MAG: hemerythrin family protein [Alphaproteobacteria bacterium]|nr:hemerythrin family protein [Alphaproteobacteria bacterium]